MKKRIVSVVIAMVLCLAAMIPAAAVNTANDNWAWKATVDGTNVTLSCVLADNSGKMAAGKVTLTYDTAKYTLGTVTVGDLKDAGFEIQENHKTAGQIGVNAFAANGKAIAAGKEYTLFTVTFTMSAEDETLAGLTRTNEVVDENATTVNDVVSAIDITVNKGVLGDLDGNEVVDDTDAVYLLNYTFMPDFYPIGDAFADFDHNGVVDDADAVYLLNYTFMPDFYPLSK